jgi:AcrR family transcriptional regulator
MAYEVIKTIGAGKYRYAVESIRDPQTGKVKNKWRYLGKADSERPPRRRDRAEETRRKITAALERLLLRSEWNDVTAHRIAAEAQVAPATLYRYFTSRNDVLLGCASHANEQLDERLAQLQNIAKTIDDERARMREWTIALIEDAPAGVVLFALWSSGLSRDEIARERNEHRRAAFAEYLTRLRSRSFVNVSPHDVDALAIALALMVQAFSYRAVLGRQPLRIEERAALADAIERLIFAGAINA